MKRILAMTAALAAAMFLGGCAYNAGGSTYHPYEAMGEQQVRFGVVESVRDVRIQPPNTGVGSATGAMVGGIAGSYVGGGTGEVVGAIFGTMLGSILGHNIEHEANAMQGIEVTVLLDSGRYVAVVQQADEAFRAGDRVRILQGRTSIRVTH